MRRIRERVEFVLPAELATFDPDQWSGEPIAGHVEWPHPGVENSAVCVELNRKARRWRQARAQWRSDEDWPGPDAVNDGTGDAEIDRVHTEVCGCQR